MTYNPGEEESLYRTDDEDSEEEIEFVSEEDLDRDTESRLPFLVELIPGSTSDGLYSSFDSYDRDMTIREAVEACLKQPSRSEEDEILRNRIVKELGGDILAGIDRIDPEDYVGEYAELLETDDEHRSKYMSLALRLNRIHEGGSNAHYI